MNWELIRRARDILGREKGHVVKDPGGKVRVAVVFPNSYHVGMSNLGLHKVYSLLNMHETVLCERAFLPSSDEMELLRKAASPLISLESQTPLAEFDVIAFSVAFESDYINLLRILELSNVPVTSMERGDIHPLVMAGGVCILSNPEPLAPFVDLFVLGEGEDIISEMIEVFEEWRQMGGSKGELLKALARLQGAYVPSGYRPLYNKNGDYVGIEAADGFPSPIEKRWVKELDKHPTSTVIVTPDTEFGNMFLVEVGRGCGRGCRFCLAGMVYRPYRNYSLETLVKEFEKGLQHKDTIGLVGSAIYDHPQLEEICQAVVDRGGKVSVPSVRLESITPRLLDLMVQSGQRTLTVAPEAGTPRLRRIIRKSVEDDEIFDSVLMAMDAGMRNLRLYFQVGLPTETDYDVEAVVGLVRRIKHVMLKSGRSKGRMGRITVSLNPFIPKPWTPFQWEPMEDEKSLQRKIKMVKSGLKGEGNVNLIHELPKWSYVQALLSRGDRRVGDILHSALKSGGDWKRAFREVNINPDYYVYRERGEDEVFPYDHLDVRVGKDMLLRERARSREGSYDA